MGPENPQFGVETQLDIELAGGHVVVDIEAAGADGDEIGLAEAVFGGCGLGNQDGGEGGHGVSNRSHLCSPPRLRSRRRLVIVTNA